MTPQERMEAVYRDNPHLGRHKLAAMAGVNETTAKVFLARKKHGATQLSDNQPPPDTLLSGLTEHEVAIIRRGLQVPRQEPPAKVEWGKSSFKFAAMGDSHIGHQKAHKAWWDKACSFIDKEKCAFVFHTGDITEGMSGRDGHVYELDAIGASAQLDMAAQRLNMLPCPTKGITGNHDLWGYKTIGFDPGAELATRCTHFEYLGQNEAVVNIGGVDVMLSHPGDGSAYAVSYAMQQFINALSGGEKPHVLLMGHHHKAMYMLYRNIHAFETATLCAQTGWMRGKKLQAHCGFWVVEVWPDATGVERIKSEFVPFYN